MATSLVADVSVISVNSMASTVSSLATPPVANSSVTSMDSVDSVDSFSSVRFVFFSNGFFGGYFFSGSGYAIFRDALLGQEARSCITGSRAA